MRNKPIQKFALANLCLIISAASLLGIARCSLEEGRSAASVAIAVLFWTGLLGGHWLNWQCGRQVRPCGQKNSPPVSLCKSAMFTFGTNKCSIIIDFLMFVFLAAFALLVWSKIQQELIQLLMIALAYLFTNLHCLYNGTYMKYRSQKKEGDPSL